MLSPRRPLLAAAAVSAAVLLLAPPGLPAVGAVALTDSVPRVVRELVAEQLIPPAEAATAPTVAPAPAPGRTGDDRPSRDAGRPELAGPELTARAAERQQTLSGLAEQVRDEAERLDAEARRAAAERRAAEEAAGYDLDLTDPRDIARELAANEYGWTGEQWGCIDELITQESSWNPRAENPSSGAYGLVQALPAEKMATVADDWRTNPATQLRWGFGYIEDVYGTPCEAWSFHLAHNWY
ncbi:transglycosylase SLT domain-containing protein [Auraticoccus sp. F435]|uniref:Transglycosylase SLT domain-containing protein n=1 Tax=Auraticoccus cholistanensis TaxID=2656650 RepID=A0A6A9V115_9ACTN|nr:transglycosylase SLT domain-containing protein [Auraticoccus cholistanensis]MVA76310.1 transglycosylase SLT domain-containing protein [Auraticoccus cholistanensis]